MSLIDAISDILKTPLSSFGKAAVNAYTVLPGLDGWMPPPGFQPFEALSVLQRVAVGHLRSQ